MYKYTLYEITLKYEGANGPKKQKYVGAEPFLSTMARQAHVAAER
jgi:hypothetical protein